MAEMMEVDGAGGGGGGGGGGGVIGAGARVGPGPAAWDGRTHSDDEADASLEEHFPRFRYGEVLRFSRVLESSAPEECILPAHAVDLPDAVPDLSNTVVEVSDDEMDAFDTLTVAPFSRQPQPTPTEHPGELQDGSSAAQASPVDDSDAKTASDRQKAKSKRRRTDVEDGGEGAGSELLEVEAMSWENEILWSSAPADSAAVGSLERTVALAKQRRKNVEDLREEASKKRKLEAEEEMKDGGLRTSTGAAAGAAADSTGKSATTTAASTQHTKYRQDEEEARRTEAGVVVPDDVASSIFAPRSTYLDDPTWLDEICWDAKPLVAGRPESTQVIIDLNDEHLNHSATVELPVFLRSLFRIKQLPGRNRVPTWKLRQQEKEEERKRLDRRVGGLPLPNSTDDPFNISSDSAYRTKEGTTTTDLSLKKCIGKRVQGLEHSQPAKKLICFKYQLSKQDLRTFHRPMLKKVSRKKTDKVRIQSFAESLADAGSAAPSVKESLKWKATDLTAMDGTLNSLILAEFSEQYPLHIQQRGMCTMIRNYYKQAHASDIKAPKFKHGTAALVGPRDASPFLGRLKPKQSVQSFENNLYRAPIYPHKMAKTDFLVVRSRNIGSGIEKYSIRRLPVVYTVGQLCPKMEIPDPNSKEAKNFAGRRLSAYIKRLFLSSKKPVAVKNEDIRKVFPQYTEGNIRNRLKEVAEYKRGTIKDNVKRHNFDNGQWELRSDVKLTSRDVESELTPEDVCIHEQAQATVQRLRDFGYGDQLAAEDADDEADDDGDMTAQDEVRLAPWRLTQDFLNCVRDKCLLYITGRGEPTGCGEGFSYLRLPHKAVSSKAPESKFTPGGYVAPKKAQPLANTNRDLRKLNLAVAKKTLIDTYGYDQAYLDTIGRWEVINLVKMKSTEEAKVLGVEHRFARGQRSSAAEQEHLFKSECQRIFDLQNRSLASTEVLSTDESDDDSSEEDVATKRIQEEMEDVLGNKRHRDVLKENREKGALKDLQAMLESDTAKSSTSTKVTDAMNDARTVVSTVASGTTAPGRRRRVKLVITRFVGEYSEKRKETVTDPEIMSAYLKAKAVKEGTHASTQNMRREQKRLRDQLKRMKKKRQEDEKAIETQSLISDRSGSPTPSHVSVARSTKEERGGTTMKCGRCGGVGHIRTNKSCPLYAQRDDSTFQDEIDKRAQHVADGVTDLEGTTLKIKTKKLSAAKRVRADGKRMMAQEKSRRRKLSHADFELSNKATVQRGSESNRVRRNPEVVLNSAISDIIAVLRAHRLECRGYQQIDWFNHRVDTGLYPSYLLIIEKPIDLGAMQKKATADAYRSRREFLADVRQMVWNAKLYNCKVIEEENPVYLAAAELRMVAINRMSRRAAVEFEEAEKQLDSFDGSVTAELMRITLDPDTEKTIDDQFYAKNCARAQTVLGGLAASVGSAAPAGLGAPAVLAAVPVVPAAMPPAVATTAPAVAVTTPAVPVDVPAVLGAAAVVPAATLAVPATTPTVQVAAPTIPPLL